MTVSFQILNRIPIWFNILLISKDINHIRIFYIALRLYGKDWKKVERHIKTRSGSQIRSHAQKFFQNDERSKGMDIDEYVLHL